MILKPNRSQKPPFDTSNSRSQTDLKYRSFLRWLCFKKLNTIVWTGERRIEYLFAQQKWLVKSWIMNSGLYSGCFVYETDLFNLANKIILTGDTLIQILMRPDWIKYDQDHKHTISIELILLRLLLKEFQNKVSCHVCPFYINRTDITKIN